MSGHPNPDLDLTISRIIKAPRALVWRAWSDPASFEQWWIPAPTICKVIDLDLRPGGSFLTHKSEGGGPFEHHLAGCFLEVVDGERIVFTNLLTGGWRPAEQGFVTAIISFRDHPDGTEYGAHLMHRNAADRRMHEDLGFYQGWGAVISQLAALVERQA
ncbi:SRPBCC family protein [Azospirillum picis]|uniref:Uncharacterized protein YndB with AHSA1/START domain n=1 Tax=Azospirillum picis TaxID=488438 RepID=A0ABU0MGE2_9PROT|nr:SRPBCC family protein [Azospirillum picis]MBP2298645.1 uncharacterized protein YndB with AHSA1/START domain [Azospirillum picis]MDQ0532306.1 uncharacterized protein YndB with AHSA1/START domain [Azospirillum picis]